MKTSRAAPNSEEKEFITRSVIRKVHEGCDKYRWEGKMPEVRIGRRTDLQRSALERAKSHRSHT